MIKDLSSEPGKVFFTFENEYSSCDCEVDKNNDFKLFVTNIRICGFDMDISDKTHLFIKRKLIDQLDQLCKNNHWKLFNF